MGKAATLTVIGLVAACGCGQAPRVSQPTDPYESTRASLLEEIPLGTSIDEAQSAMEAKGYICSVRRNDSFAVYFSGEQKMDHTRIDYLLCVKSIRFMGSPGEGEEQIAIVLAQDSVADILVTRDFTAH